MNELIKIKSFLKTYENKKDLYEKLKLEENKLKKSDIDSILYARFIGFNLRLERLISVEESKEIKSSDSFEAWKKDWLETF